MNKDKAASGLFFYVQDERYVVLPWMAKNDDVQDERYVVLPWMAKNDDVQDERYVVLPWMAKNDDVQDEGLWPFLDIHAFSALVLPARHFSS